MNLRSAALWLLAVIVAAALAGAWLYTFKRVEKEIDLPPRGEARYNPLFALKLALQAQGATVHTGGGTGLDIDALGPHDTLLLYDDIRRLDETASYRLLEWVEQGGHLIFALHPGEEAASPLLDALSLYKTSHFRCLDWSVPAATAGAATHDVAGKEQAKDDKDRKQGASAAHCFNARFLPLDDEEDLGERFEWLWGNDSDGYLLGRALIGDGSVFVAGELDFLANDDLSSAGHAALAWQVLAPALDGGHVHLVYASSVPPLHVMIVRHGWPLLVPLLLALLAWLWAQSQRFGPLLPVAPAHRRALLEHVHAAGEFAFRRGRASALHAAVLRLFMTRLRSRTPEIAALEGEALVQALSQRCGHAAAPIRQALMPFDLGRTEPFVATIRTLMQLRARL